MSYVIKLGAYGLAGVAAFAVAVALMLSASSTPTAEAVIQLKDGTTFTPTGAGDAFNGDTRYSQHESTDGFVRFEISTTGAASASFTHAEATNDGQAIICNAGATGARNDCDADLTDPGVTVAIKIDNDSGKGVVFVKQTRLTGTGGVEEVTEAIDVTVAQVPARISVKAASSSINSGQGAAPAGSTTVDLRLIDTNGGGIAGKALTIVSTRALLSSVTDSTSTDDDEKTVSGETVTLGAFTGASLAGTVMTTEDSATDADPDVDTRGWARVVVTGGGSPGISTITVTYLDVTATVDIVLHGAVKTISAELEQGAIEIGGMTRIVVTALDAGGNPVKDQVASIKTRGITPPERLANPVEVDLTVNKNTAGSPNTLTGSDIPSCEAHGGTDDDTGTADVDESRPASTGTNADGKCVIEVSAPDETGTANDAARGTHTITVVAGSTGTSPRGVNEATVEVQVGGPPTAIESDAPARLDPSGEVTVNLTVLDDEGVRVGAVVIEVFQTAGDGKIISADLTKTTDGRAKFTYLAPSTPGVAEFLVRTRDKPATEAGSKVTASLPIIVQVAEEAPPEPPAPPTPEVSVSGESGLVVVQNAGSIEDILGALMCGSTTGTTVTLPGNNIYAVGAPAVVNAGFLANVSFPIELAAAYVSCGG